jgi:hypothetical protein
MKNEIKICQNCKNDFVIEPDDFSFYEKIKVPPPTFCPECRAIRRFVFKNERSLCKRKCNAPSHTEEIISMYSSKSNLIIYDKEYWWSDKWDALQYGKDYDFSQPFFEQFKSLQEKVPRPPLVNNNSVNSDYCNFADENKNCYLLTTANRNEDSFYGFFLVNNRYTSECLFCLDAELLSKCVDCQECYNLFNSQDCKSCLESAFLIDCRGCNNCLFCVGLRNKNYYLFNKPCTKEEFQIAKGNIFGSYSNYLKSLEKFKELKIKFPIRKSNNFIKCQNVVGDFIFQSRNIKNGFDVYDTENSSHLQQGIKAKDCYDTASFDSTELCYDSISLGLPCYENLFVTFCRSSNGLIYCDNCHGCENLFGCISLRNKSYCILNRQYTKEQYEELIPKIIQHMSDMPYIDSKGRIYKYGEFFPSELSPFCYNETIAQEYFPLTKEQAKEQGYKWKDKEERNYSIDIYNKDIPDNIADITDDITDKIIECAHKGECNQQCTEAFKIIPEELQFYRRMNLPLPRLCPNCRHYERLSERNPLKLWHRSCMNKGCTNTFETSYSPERPEIVYCEKCYQQEVY